ncbi:MAG TPA: hypothetical protein VGS08_01445 [Candidatus Saccharimonadales bacterium]|nr:hypothetical protein [Candidatus Saccharimonadales bacterium]
MDEQLSQKPSKGYGKHSKKYWAVVYLIAAIVVYALIYLLFIHKNGSGY